MESLKVTKEEIMEVAKYNPKEFPKYTASVINLLNRWAGGTASKIVGQMSDEVIECPHRDYNKWREWYLKRHPKSIEDATNLIMKKFEEVKKGLDKIDRKIVELWVEDLVIDKSFWGLKVQEAILNKIEKKTGIKCRLANKDEESKGFDGFIGNNAVQIKPDSYKVASNVKTEKSRAKIIFYKKEDGDYQVDLNQVQDYLKS